MLPGPVVFGIAQAVVGQLLLAGAGGELAVCALELVVLGYLDLGVENASAS